MNRGIRLWIADTAALGLEKQLDELLKKLPDEEREKAFRYQRQADRLRCAVGRVMIRALAARTMGTPDVPLRVSEYGKPAFARADAPQFSLSHSGDLVALAAGDEAVGVDVEEICDVDWKAFEPWLSVEEERAIAAAPEPLRAFYRIWTAREAFSKLDGRGIGIFEDERVRRGYRDSGTAFRTFEPQRHVLTLCARRIPEGLAGEALSQEDWREMLELA